MNNGTWFVFEGISHNPRDWPAPFGQVNDLAVAIFPLPQVHPIKGHSTSLIAVEGIFLTSQVNSYPPSDHAKAPCLRSKEILLGCRRAMTKMSFSAMLKQKPEFVASLGLLGILSVLYALLGASTWAVEPIESATRFCEDISDGLIKEPINTLSNLTYIVVGLVILWNLPAHTGAAANPILA